MLSFAGRLFEAAGREQAETLVGNHAGAAGNPVAVWMCEMEALVVFTVFEPWDVSFRALCRKNQEEVSF